MKPLSFAIGLLFAAAGLLVILVPASLISLAQSGVHSLELYAFSIVRILLGLLFWLVARQSRLPRLMRVFGVVTLLAGAATPLVGVQGAQTIAAWWSHQTLALVRVVGLLPLTVGALIAYACGPSRRAA